MQVALQSDRSEFEDDMASFGKPLIVTAIDFGTTFSGYAFSTLNDYEKGPLHISAASKWAGDCVSLKNSTCVLFDPKGKFHSFGYEAEEKYAELALDKSYKTWHFFRRFKMEMYENQELNRDSDLTDANGKTMKAMTVITSVIRYLKEHFTKSCSQKLLGLEESDILWVLTVPAIWSEAAKQFMREAAYKAGLPKEGLIVVLEPEVASLYCKHISVEKTDGILQEFPVGTRYLVLDAGGGTIDITVHEVQENGSLKALICANGGNWGGTKVDDAFFDFLTRIIGKRALDSFKSKHAMDMMTLNRDLEKKKRKVRFKQDTTTSIIFNIPKEMEDCCKEHNGGKKIADMITSSHDLQRHVSVVADTKLKIDGTIAKNWFVEPVQHIIDHLTKIVNDPAMPDITAIMMVGGFSDSDVLRETINANFRNIKVITPDEAELAVLKGAVIYGHEPRTIQTRVCKYTYGVETTVMFEEGLHDRTKRYKTGDREVRCKDIFDTHVRAGETVFIGEPQKVLTYEISEADSTGMDFPVYRSTERDPMYVTDPSCTKIGKLCVEMPDISEGLHRSVQLHMTFGNTELEVEAIDPSSGESFTASFDFLE